jgi:hypothetical protein
MLWERERRLHGSALAVAEHHDERHTEFDDGVLGA